MKMEDGGLYVLVLRLKKGQKIKVAKLAETYFSSGGYLYVGRAKRGLKKRLERHLRKDKKLFWHIDYFLRKAEVMDVWIKLNSFDECRVVSQIRKFIENSVIPQKNLAPQTAVALALFFIFVTSMISKICGKNLPLRGLKFMEFKFKPIGVVHSPFKRNEDINVKKFADPQGFDQFQRELEIFKKYEEGLKDTEGFSHLIVIFAFHK